MDNQLFVILIHSFSAVILVIYANHFINLYNSSLKGKNKIMKIKVTHVIQKTAKTGSSYFVFISQGSMNSKAVTVFGNTPCIGCDSIAELAEVVVNLEKGQSLEVDFVADQSNNIAVAIVC